MTLADLKKAVDGAYGYAIECENNPAEIPVTLEFHRFDQDAITSDDQVEVHYDNNSTASGCVITAWLDDSKQPANPNAGIAILPYEFEKIANGWLNTCPDGTRVFCEDINAMMKLLTDPLIERLTDLRQFEWSQKFKVLIGSDIML